MCTVSKLTVRNDPNEAGSRLEGDGHPQKSPRDSSLAVCTTVLAEKKLIEMGVSKNKGALKDEGVERAKLLDASIDEKWFTESYREEKLRDGRARLISLQGKSILPKTSFEGRAWPFRLRLPLPSKELLRVMEQETDQLPREAPPGPIAAAWLERVEVWIWHLRLHFRGTRRRVCGVWRDLYAHWVVLLKALPKKRRERVLKMIREGVDLPWGMEKPASLRHPKTGGCPENVNLEAERDRVWETLHEQLVEEAIVPWDCLGKEDVDVLPLGMFPIFWTTKAGSEKVRIIIDLRRLNKFLSTTYCSVELPSVRGGRLKHQKGDRRIGWDLHSSFYHGMYKKKTRKWLGFSIRDSELTQEAVQWLWRNVPQCRWRDRWVFVYASFAMGASHSVADFQEIMSAMKDACLASGVGSAYKKTVKQWKGEVFIDDVDAATSERATKDGTKEQL